MSTSPNISFPLLCISYQHWEDEKLLEYILFDKYIYTDNIEVHRELMAEKYCDCKGYVITIKEFILPKQRWRKIFKFIPGVYKVTCLFRKHDQRIELEELRTYILKRVSNLSKDAHREEWISQLKKARSHEELIAGSSS